MYTLLSLALISVKGFGLFIYAITMYMLVRDPRRRRVSYGMIVASTTLMLLTTTVSTGSLAHRSIKFKKVAYQEFVTNIVRLVRAHITVGPKRFGGAEAFYQDSSELTFVLKGCLFPFQILILDGVVVGRPTS